MITDTSLFALPRAQPRVRPRNETKVHNLTAEWPVVWSEKDAELYKCILCRDVHSQETEVTTFARAYRAPLMSARTDPIFDKQGMSR